MNSGCGCGDAELSRVPYVGPNAGKIKPRTVAVPEALTVSESVQPLAACINMDTDCSTEEPTTETGYGEKSLWGT